ncbi:MAG: aminoacyl-tRNA deacylase [Phycisphaeraceae bacterium]
MPLDRLTDYLDTHQIKYQVIHHSPAYTAQEIAAAAHIPGREVAKTVVVEIDGKMHVIALPAPAKVDFARLREQLQARNATLASESRFQDRFPGCELGAMPPLGSLFEMPVIVDEALTRDEVIYFNACSHRELIRMRFEDFARLEHPKVLKLSAVAKA